MSTFDRLIEAVAWGAPKAPARQFRTVLRGFGSANASATIIPKLGQGDDKSVVLAGVRIGVYSVERIGKKPVVVNTTPAEQEDLK